MRKRARIHRQSYVVDNARAVRATEEEMLHQFRITKLLPWHLIAVERGIPKDLRLLVASKVRPNYKRHPIWEFIEQHGSTSWTITHCVFIYKHTPLYNHTDDPKAIRKRPFYVTPARIPNYCYSHGNAIVWLVPQCDANRREIEEDVPVVLLDH